MQGAEVQVSPKHGHFARKTHAEEINGTSGLSRVAPILVHIGSLYVLHCQNLRDDSNPMIYVRRILGV